MDQLKLLNFHKMLANFANNLVGAFVALIVYQATGKLIYGIAYLTAVYAFRLVYIYALRKLYGKYPQLFLMLRIIPITLYNLFIFVLDYNLIIGVIGVCLFNSLDTALNNLSKEIIFNYASLTNKTEKDSSIGVTRLFEQGGIIIAILLGGFLLDVNKTLVLVLSLSIYSISVIPLIMFYIKCRHQKTFNKDATSNAITTFKKDEELKKESQKITKKLLFTYFIVYFSFAFVDLMTNSYGLYVFSKMGEFSTAGILNAIYHLCYALGFYIANVINNKKDTTKLVTIFSFIIGICVIALPFVPLDRMFIVVCLIYGIIAFSSTFLSLFVLDRMLLKSRIMACSNRALFVRESSCNWAYVFGNSFGLIGIIVTFIVIGIMMCASGIVIPIAEEKTRQHLVDYLQNNEKMNNHSTPSKSRAKRIASANKIEKT